MPLPNVLLIGAMKAGTTSLYMDLASHPQVFLPHTKEPHCLCDENVLSPPGRMAYQQHYAAAGADQRIIDASTGYSKRPDYEGVPQRAAQVLSDGFQVLYVVRNPIERIVSQYRHESTAGEVTGSLDEEVRRHPRFVNYSRYAYQLQPWLTVAGRDRVHIVCFEDYVNHRDETLAAVCQFLGLDPNQLAAGESKVYNKSERKPVRNRFWDQVFYSNLYRSGVRHLLAPRLRLKLMQLFLPKGSSRSSRPLPETLHWLHSQLAADIQEFYDLLPGQQPLWENLGKAPDSTANPLAAT